MFVSTNKYTTVCNMNRFFDSERILDAQIADVNPSNSIEDGKDDMFSF